MVFIARAAKRASDWCGNVHSRLHAAAGRSESNMDKLALFCLCQPFWHANQLFFKIAFTAYERVLPDRSPEVNALLMKLENLKEHGA